MDEMLIKGGTIVDGTGSPRFQGDLLVAGGKVKEVGGHLTSTGDVIDANGLVVAPGIIDPHTHMDAQLQWEPRGTPCSWNGVTTVMTGMCGYSLAPCRPQDRDYIVKMFCRVEEMPLEVLEAGIDWSWTTFREWADALDHGLGINAAPMVGHSSMRYYVMGADALEREATPGEMSELCRVLRESLDGGAFGFTTSRAPTHSDWDWRPVPSRQARPEELTAMASELRGLGSTSMGLIPTGVLGGMTEEDKAAILEMSRASGRPIQLNGMGPGGWEFVTGNHEGADLWAVLGSQPGYRMWTLREGTNYFNSMDSWRQIMELPEEERLPLLASPENRETLRCEVEAEQTMPPLLRRRPQIRWQGLMVQRTTREENRHFEGQSIQQLAESQGRSLADTLLDLVISEDFGTEFRSQFQEESEFFDEAKASQLRSPRGVPMSTDSGAHLSHECRAGDGAYFLKNWVIGRGYLTLEEGVRQVTSRPAEYIGLKDRGVLREGAAADIIVFDPEGLGVTLKERAFDMPGGAKRWVQKATGMEHVLVNGRRTIKNGQEAGELPGRMLRSSWYR